MKNNAQLQSEILQLEHKVWQAVVEKDPSSLENLFSENYIEITHQGKRVERTVVVEQSPQLDEIEHYEIQDEKFVILSDKAVILSYHLSMKGTCDGVKITPVDRWATSVWNFEADSWKCTFFQQSSYIES